MSLAPFPEGDAREGGEEIRLVSSRGSLPAGPCLVSFLVRDDGHPAGLRLYAEVGEGTDPLLLHEFELPAGGGEVEHLVHFPNGLRSVILRPAGPGSSPALARVRVSELGPVPLAAVLATRWIRLQVRQPWRLPQKLGNLVRVLRREGIRGAMGGLVASQAARQAAPFSPERRVEWGFAYRGAWAEEPYPPAPKTKGAFDRTCRAELESFLASDARLPLPSAQSPSVTIVVVLYNRAELTLACLRSVADHAPPDADVVLIDNGSSDETAALLYRVDGARIVRNPTNLGFLRACNQGVANASAASILLLNNDAFLLPGSVNAALERLADPTVGVVGGRLVAMDGRLQEAGSFVWNDGLCWGYGRRGDPNGPQYRFRRDVDFVSGAFLLTRRDLWQRLGGFDEAFAPAYFEDADYCLRVWQAGYRVVYEPEVVVVHYEYASSSGPDQAAALMLRNQEVFAARHRAWIADRPASEIGGELANRSVNLGNRRILMVDDRIPLAAAGSGFPRTAVILRGLVSLGFEVTFYPMEPFLGTWNDVYEVLPPEIEVMLGWGRQRLELFLADRRGLYDVVLVSRAHNLAALKRILSRNATLVDGATLVYDAEAIGAWRHVLERQLAGDPLSPQEADALVREEVDMAAGAHRVTSVTPAEMRAFREAGARDVFRLSHGVDPVPTPRSFVDRRTLLFVGRMLEDNSPNVDALVWFLDAVLPVIREELSDLGPPEMVLVGQTGAAALEVRRGPGVRFLGAVDDLRPLYDEARVFVAPHRFSAGIPIKVVEASAHGVPAVVTDLLLGQLGWTAGQEVLSSPVGEAGAFARHCVALYRDGELWTRVREAALRRVADEFSIERFVETLDQALLP